MRFGKFFFLTALVVSSSLHATAGDFDKTQCHLPADQGLGSLAGSWDQLPISLVLDSEFYSADQGKTAAAFKRAVKTWNDWAVLKGKVAFVIQNDGVGAPIPRVASCNQSDYTAAFPQAVGVWKIAKEGDRANRRPSCSYLEKILPNHVQAQTDWTFTKGNIVGGSVLLNYDTINSPDGIAIDEESLFLHQLGSLLGLLHSCNGSTADSVDSTSAPHCSVAKPEYLEAVMSPFLSSGELRRELKKNDFERVNCLY